MQWNCALGVFLFAAGLAALPCSAMTLDEHLDAPSAATEVAPAATEAMPETPERAAITGYLRGQIGEPYRFGAAGGREGFDCSGLVLRAYEAAGRAVPRVSKELIRTGNAVSPQALRAGDLLFYRMRSNRPDLLHVVVYVGEGRAIHASVGHRQVREIDITRSVWSKRLVAARTLL